jgi:hypothetical protein
VVVRTVDVAVAAILEAGRSRPARLALTPGGPTSC